MKRHVICCVLVAVMCLFVSLPTFAAEQNPTGDTAYTQTFYLDGLSQSNSKLVGFITASFGTYYQTYFFTGQQTVFAKDCIYSFYIYNYNDYPVYLNSSDISITIAPKFDDQYTKPRLGETTPISGEMILTRISGNTHYFKAAAGYNLSNYIYIPAKGHIMCVWKQQFINLSYYTGLNTIGFNCLWGTPAIPITYYDASDVYPSYESYLAAIAEGMQQHSQQSDDVQHQTDDVTQDLETQHQQEQSYFDQSTQAAADTGISSWTIDNNTGEGIAFAANSITRMWTAIGPLSSVIVFVLLMKFATLILRHRGSGGGAGD